MKDITKMYFIGFFNKTKEAFIDGKNLKEIIIIKMKSSLFLNCNQFQSWFKLLHYCMLT